ncbi:MAG: 2,3-bisphosphoglycerate-independent phosphoglycerate mutase [Clostridiaceae bacterium]|jgi:2,3-bisphosphoglycerate-independent phosphoglycerate mutase|nr:2,3-bisphosphoglycerate-independent phosphoglycerate mutase [Clostridiaceae bacterium]
MTKRVLLCIMDGWGISTGSKNTDATVLANPIHVEEEEKTEKFIKIHADGEYVGLPEGQMGNSEVGHLNLGAGRIVYQDLSKINRAIKDGTFFKNPEFLKAVEHSKQYDSALHIYGLVSTGGVHSSLEHIMALVKFAADQGVKKFYVHAFLDGRDTPPQSACTFLQPIEDELKKYNLPPIATISGRYYAMDRDNRWDRVEKAYNALLIGEGEHSKSSIDGVKESYARGDNDEFVLPTVIGGEESRIHDNDSIIFFNFRPDRAREITKAMILPEFDGFKRKAFRKNLYYVCMTKYDENLTLPIAFPKEHLVNILGDVLEANGINQFRTAETEKYAHVTFFFNGGVEQAQPHETRALVASPKVATYDLQPEMSAPQVCENVLKAIDNPEYGFILVNFANPDMVGHTGVLEAAIKACKTVDECVGKIVEACKKHDITMLLTADHGNAEVMVNEQTGKPQTAHTTNEVPFVLINGPKDAQLKDTGALCDIAPTILQLMNISQPKEMTGQSLIK